MKNIGSVLIAENKNEQASFLVDTITRMILETIENGRTFSIAVSGGTSPLVFFESLAKQNNIKASDWSKVGCYWVDERCVPVSDSMSNFGNAYKLLKDIPAKFYPLFPEDQTDTLKAAIEYEQILEKLPQTKGFPIFDLILLGMGDDGHIASLFPGTIALQEKSRTVVLNEVPQLQANRLTLTFPVLKNAAKVFILINGAKKLDLLVNMIKEDIGLPVEELLDGNTDIVWSYSK